MNEMQLTIVPDGTPEQAQAMGLHCVIMSAAQAAADTLLALGRKLKQMRDSGGFRHLGFDTFEAYTETAVGIRQRQAYNYISIVEKIPAQLVEENAAAGVTKLALLAKLAPADQREVAPELADITVTELKKLIDEKNGLAEQLSMLQDQPIEAPAEEVDMDAALELVRQEERQRAEDAIDTAVKEAQEHAARDKALAVEEAKQAARKRLHEIEDGLQKQIDALKKQADAAEAKGRRKAEEATAQKILEARQQTAEAVRKEQEAAYKEKIEEARRDADQAQKTIEELRMQSDRDSLRFSMLFEQLQGKAGEMMDLLDSMASSGKMEQAEKLHRALAGALQALAAQVQEKS